MSNRFLRTLVVLSLVFLLSLSFLQSLPTTKAEATNHDTSTSKAPRGFKLAGAAPDALPVLASIGIPLRNLDRLSTLVQQVSDPGSPMFRRFLTDDQIAADFLPSTQFNDMMHYLSGTGLKVQFTALDSIIVVQGTVAQLKQYFGTGVNIYTNGTSSYYMSTSQTFNGAYFHASNATGILARRAVSTPPLTRANVTFTSGAFSAKELQAVYNATGLYAMSINGSGKTIGILDFYGSPTITQDLKLFDQQFGIPDSKFQIIPIGPYAPNLGAYTGWSREVSLDVEVSHTMAPGANIELYVANGALTQAAAIAAVVKDNTVNTLSQSYTFPEWLFNFYGASIFEFNVLLPDQYYMLGSLKGITFMGSTGDTGGSGFTSGVEGELGYPASSPYNTALGGTQTHFSAGSFVQTAWSNLGFVPNGVNYGGSTGGVSILEPKPWYQNNWPTPASFPNGRMNPDISLQGGVDPATYIVDSGQILSSGGTSESSPLFAGLVTLLDQYVKGSVGLLNPFLYQLANNPASYAKAYTQIKFGYNIPWTASSGYNLVTGLGAPNIGEMAALYGALTAPAGLNITLQLSRGSDAHGLEHTAGTTLTIAATVSSSARRITTGSLTATMVTLRNVTSVPLTYNAGLALWTGRITMGQQAGMAYVQVQGSSGGLSGTALATFFAGYYGQFYAPIPTDPWSTIGGLSVIVQSMTLDGNLTNPPQLQTEVDSYSILTNQYRQVDSITLVPSLVSLIGQAETVVVNSTWPTGPMTMVLGGGTWGYLPFVNGIYLQTTYIYPEVAAEPGSVAAGQKLTLIADPIAPFNLFFTVSQETSSYFGNDLEFGSNVTAYLVDHGGNILSTARLAYQACLEALKVCGGGSDKMNGYLSVPSFVPAGLYTILLTANYSSYTIGKTVSGSYYSQVWVTQAPLTPAVAIVPGPVSARSPDKPLAQSSFFQGQTAHVVAQISYPNGTAVKYGEFTAIVYPQELANSYTSIMHSEYVGGSLTSLVFNPSMGAWVGNVTLPSPFNPGALAPVSNNSLYYSGPYDAYVTGITADGFTTTTAISAQRSFFIQPFVYMTGALQSMPQTSGLVFSGATLNSPASLSGDLFLGTNSITGGAFSISTSQVQGTLVLTNAKVSLTGVYGGDINAVNSALVLVDSSVGTLTLTNSTVTLSSASYLQVSPPQATVSFGSVSPQPVGGKFNVTASVLGQLVPATGISMWVDGSPVTPAVTPRASGMDARTSLDASSLADGLHIITVTATQSDGISTTATTYVSTNGRISTLGSMLQQANKQIGQLSGQVSNMTSQLRDTAQQLGTFVNLSYGLAVVALMGVAVGIMALRRKPATAPQ